MVAITDYTRFLQPYKEYSFNGTAPVVGDLIATDFSMIGNDVTVDHYEISFWCDVPSNCTLSILVAFADGTTEGGSTSESGWIELYYDKRIISYQFTVAGTNTTAKGTVGISSLSALVYFEYEIEEQKSVIYSVKNAVLDGVDDYIDTGVQLMQHKTNWILYVDFTSNEELSNEATVLQERHESALPMGFVVDLYNTPNGRLILNGETTLYDTPIAGNRHKIAFRRQGVSFDYIIPNGSIVEADWDIDYQYIEETLLLGAGQTAEGYKYGFWGGTINECKVWSGYMSDEEFVALMQDVPTITIGTPSKTRISAVSGHDKATVTFTSDMALSQWEARATTSGQAVGHGSGLLVESGGSLEANTETTVTIDDEELTNGDLEYTISIFGQSVEGRWSDG
jgi:hypothetical protein